MMPHLGYVAIPEPRRCHTASSNWLRMVPVSSGTLWAPGSMEWQAEQDKAGRTAASALEPLSLAGDPAAGRDN